MNKGELSELTRFSEDDFFEINAVAEKKHTEYMAKNLRIPEDIKTAVQYWIMVSYREFLRNKLYSKSKEKNKAKEKIR